MGRLKNTPWKEILNNKFKYDISDDYTLEIRHAISKVRIFCAPAARAEGARRGAPVFFRARRDRSGRRLILSFCDFRVQLGRIRRCVPSELAGIRIS